MDSCVPKVPAKRKIKTVRKPKDGAPTSPQQSTADDGDVGRCLKIEPSGSNIDHQHRHRSVSSDSQALVSTCVPAARRAPRPETSSTARQASRRAMNSVPNPSTRQASALQVPDGSPTTLLPTEAEVDNVSRCLNIEPTCSGIGYQPGTRHASASQVPEISVVRALSSPKAGNVSRCLEIEPSCNDIGHRPQHGIASSGSEKTVSPRIPVAHHGRSRQHPSQHDLLVVMPRTRSPAPTRGTARLGSASAQRHVLEGPACKNDGGTVRAVAQAEDPVAVQ